jgi:FkbM family methyltransferase
VRKLKTNLAKYEARYRLQEIAVSSESGELEFGIEATGRYGGLGRKTGQSIKVQCIDVNQALGKILDQEETIDILKIDTEGVEIKTVSAIREDIARRIKKIHLEATPKSLLLPDIFEQKQYGSVCRLKNRII